MEVIHYITVYLDARQFEKRIKMNCSEKLHLLPFTIYNFHFTVNHFVHSNLI